MSDTNQYQPILDKYSQDTQSLPSGQPQPQPQLPPLPPSEPSSKFAATQSTPPPPVPDDAPSASTPPQADQPQPASPLPKIIFFISLLVFLAVIFLIVFRVISGQQAPLFFSASPSPTITAAPTNMPPASDTCLLNGQVYSVGQSFPANDNCNFCTCQPDSIISCTQLDCSN